MKKLTIVTFLFFMIALVAGSKSEAENRSGTQTSSGMKRYGLKQACIEYKITGKMFAGTEKRYFDRYGMREAKYNQQTVNVMGMKQENHTATFTNYDEDGVIYTYDFKTKSGTRMENPLKEAFKDKDMKELGKEMIVQMGGTKVGAGTVLGKKCEIWEIKNMGTKIWLWNWISLKTVTNMMGMKMSIVATKITEIFDKKNLVKPNVEYPDRSKAMKGFQGLDALKKKYRKK